MALRGVEEGGGTQNMWEDAGTVWYPLMYLNDVILYAVSPPRMHLLNFRGC